MMDRTPFFFTAIATVIIMASVPALSDQGSDHGTLAESGRVVLRIQNLYCSGCFGKIREHVTCLDGFLDMKTSMRNRLVAVDYTLPLTEEALVRAINAIGYETMVLSSQAIDTEQNTAVPEPSGCGGPCCGGTDSRNETDKAFEQGCGASARQGCCPSAGSWKKLINGIFISKPVTKP